MSEQRQERIADIDDPATWPAAVLECVHRWAGQWQGRTSYTTGIEVPLELEPSFRRQFDGYKLRAFHFTRLLDHERALVSAQGLRTLTPDLITDRIDAAYHFGAVTAAETDLLRSASVFNTGEAQNRAGRVCLVLSRNVYVSNPDSCMPLMRHWGGEAIYNSSRTSTLGGRLLALGIPCIVEAAIDICAQGEHLVFPALHRAFIGRFLNFEDAGAEVHYRAPVPPTDILGIATTEIN